MRVKFTKMHGLGNDFMLIDGVSTPLELPAEWIARNGDRRLGIGFDQLLQAIPARNVASGIGVRIYNSDGSPAAHCGNGMRCFARYLHAQQLSVAPVMDVEVAGASVRLELLEGSSVRVRMGVPAFEPGRIPLRCPARQRRYEVVIAGEELSFSAVAIGNPHAVFDVPSVRRAEVGQLGPAVQQCGLFPQGVNVGFREILGRDRIRLRVFERGAGETSACGSGACAAVVTGISDGDLEESVEVELPGGELSVEWHGAGEPVWLVGPTAEVFQGEVEL